jgi:hypothetical protein
VGFIEMTFEQIDKRAEELFRECGGLPLEWGAVDETVRNYYRVKATQRATAALPSRPSEPQSPPHKPDSRSRQ